MPQTEMDKKDIWPPPRSWKQVAIAVAILLGQASLCAIEEYAYRRDVFPDLQTLTVVVAALIACGLHFVTLRRKLGSVAAIVCAMFLGFVGMVCSMPAICLGACFVDSNCTCG